MTEAKEKKKKEKKRNKKVRENSTHVNEIQKEKKKGDTNLVLRFSSPVNCTGSSMDEGSTHIIKSQIKTTNKQLASNWIFSSGQPHRVISRQSANKTTNQQVNKSNKVESPKFQNNIKQ